MLEPDLFNRLKRWVSQLLGKSVQVNQDNSNQPQETKMVPVDLTISVNSDYLKQMPALVSKLTALGMTNTQSLDAVGVITGSIDESKIAEIHKFDGVANVERAATYRLPTPDSPTQ